MDVRKLVFLQTIRSLLKLFLVDFETIVDNEDSLTWTIGLPGSSHAETTLAGRSDVAIGLDFIVIEAGIKDSASSTGDENRFGGNLVRDSGTVKGRSAAHDDGKQENKDSVLHGTSYYDLMGRC